jgi:hypothetical protein
MSPNPEAVGSSGPRQDLIETVNACREHGELKARIEHPVYAESFRGVDHLCRIAVDAQALVNDTPATTLVDDDKS